MKAFLTLFFAVFISIGLVVKTYAGETIDKILKRGELIVGTSADNPPLTMKTKDGKIIGYDVDVAQIIATAMGVKLKLVHIEFSKLIDSLIEGKIDMIISNMTMHPPRNLRVAFVGPYYVSGMTLLTMDNLTKEIKNLQDIKGDKLKVAVSKGTTNEMVAKANIPPNNIVYTHNEDESIKLLIDGKVSGVLTDGGTALVWAYKYKEKNLVLSQPLTFEPIGIAIKGNDMLLLNFLDNFITNLKSQRKFEELFSKWTDNTSWINELP